MKPHRRFCLLLIIALLAVLLACNASLAFWNSPVRLFRLDADEVVAVRVSSASVTGLKITDRATIEHLAGTLSGTSYRLRIYDPRHRFDGYNLFGEITFYLADGREFTVCPSLDQNLLFYSKTSRLPGAYHYWEAYPPGFDHETLLSLVLHGALPNGEVPQ